MGNLLTVFARRFALRLHNDNSVARSGTGKVHHLETETLSSRVSRRCFPVVRILRKKKYSSTKPALPDSGRVDFQMCIDKNMRRAHVNGFSASQSAAAPAVTFVLESCAAVERGKRDDAARETGTNRVLFCGDNTDGCAASLAAPRYDAIRIRIALQPQDAAFNNHL